MKAGSVGITATVPTSCGKSALAISVPATASGKFSLDVVARKVEENESIRCIEIKLSQGAKPGKGGILPGRKVTAEIAQARDIPVGQDCISPNAHSEFDTVDEMIDWIERIADRTGLPVGIKSAIGSIGFWETLAQRMRESRRGTRFHHNRRIRRGHRRRATWLSPTMFRCRSRSGLVAFIKSFNRPSISQQLIWFGSGKLGFPDRAVVAFAMGCDAIQIARESMIAIGCIQALKCHTDHCPAGIATQNRWLQAGLNVEAKSGADGTVHSKFSQGIVVAFVRLWISASVPIQW